MRLCITISDKLASLIPVQTNPATTCFLEVGAGAHLTVVLIHILSHRPQCPLPYRQPLEVTFFNGDVVVLNTTKDKSWCGRDINRDSASDGINRRDRSVWTAVEGTMAGRRAKCCNNRFDWGEIALGGPSCYHRRQLGGAIWGISVKQGRGEMSVTSAEPGEQQTPPPTGGDGQPPSAQEPSKEMERSKITPLWVAILFVYMLLFGSTGYVAFVTGEYNPGLDNPLYSTEGVATFGDKKDDYLAFVIETLKQEIESYDEKRALAAQSFHVVLGAILGFLSASAAIVVGRQGKQPS